MLDEEGCCALERAAAIAGGTLEPALAFAAALNRLGSKEGALFIL